MKRTVILCTILFAFAGFCGCGKYDCANARMQLAVIGFTDPETDSIRVTRYNKGSNFQVKKDSILLIRGALHYQRNTDTVHLPNAHFPSDPLGITSGYDYEVNLIKPARTFRITEIVEEQRSEKKTSRKDLCVNRITSYKVNNQPVINNDWHWFYLKK